MFQARLLKLLSVAAVILNSVEAQLPDLVIKPPNAQGDEPGCIFEKHNNINKPEATTKLQPLLGKR